jgi:hypothetical protein
LASESRPGLAQAELAMARILDNPKAVTTQPAAAKVLAALLDKLPSTHAHLARLPYAHGGIFVSHCIRNETRSAGD